jgi:HAMP domain-containing protein
MDCDERARLEKADREAGDAFDVARKILQERIGTTPRNEFEALSKAVDTTWEAVNRARSALDGHIREHKCL